MKRYSEVLTGNSLGIISGKEFYAITYGEPMTLQDIIKQEGLEEKIRNTIMTMNTGTTDSNDKSLADAIIALLEGSKG